jgi:hypothetical protein
MNLYSSNRVYAATNTAPGVERRGSSDELAIMTKLGLVDK